MRVYINEKPVEIFEGARVIDALNKYFMLQSRAYDPDAVRIFDYHSNIIFIDGSLSELDRIYFTEL